MIMSNQKRMAAMQKERLRDLHNMRMKSQAAAGPPPEKKKKPVQVQRKQTIPQFRGDQSVFE